MIASPTDEMPVTFDRLQRVLGDRYRLEREAQGGASLPGQGGKGTARPETQRDDEATRRRMQLGARYTF